MYNYFMLAGHVEQVNECTFTLKLTEPFKNLDGKYETSSVKIYCYGVIKEVILPQLTVGKFISVKGRVKPDEVHKDLCLLIAERIMFHDENKILSEEGEE